MTNYTLFLTENSSKCAVVFANPPFGEVHDDDFFLIHEIADIEGRFRLTDNVSNEQIKKLNNLFNNKLLIVETITIVEDQQKNRNVITSIKLT